MAGYPEGYYPGKKPFYVTAGLYLPASGLPDIWQAEYVIFSAKFTLLSSDKHNLL